MVCLSYNYIIAYLVGRFRPFYRPRRPLGRVEVQPYSVLDLGTRRDEGSASRPGRFLPPGKTRYPLYSRLGGPQGRSGQVRKISPPLEFDPRNVQPVASRYPTELPGPLHTSCKFVYLIYDCIVIFCLVHTAHSATV
jgi:hypothetical protein